MLTEQRLADSMALDSMSIEAAVELMHRQDLAAVEAVGRERAAIAAAIRMVVEQFRRGGRLIYVGAGTSGRLGVLDASECPPTFRADPNMVQGIISGGDVAIRNSVEGAEDLPEGGAAAMDAKEVGDRDVVMGIAAGGTTPFVRGALDRARQRGAKTIFFCCVDKFSGEPQVDVTIRPLVGPEVVTGSTRLKAGTATKLVLNAITTIAMVQLGKVYENLMVDLRASNTKLRDRAARIVATVTGLRREEAFEWVDRAGGHVKLAILMCKRGLDAETAATLLERHGGKLRAAMES